jgi:ferredoxin--NADP+ reductase
MPPTEEKFYRARIVERVDFSEDLWKIRVEPGGEFKFAPGQYATLGVQTPEKHIERAYSIVSSPYEKEVEFFFELVPQGELTPKLYLLKNGDTLTFRKISKGRFTLDRKSGHTHHLLLCTVTGVAPFISYVRTMYRDWKDGKLEGGLKLHLLFGASRSWEFGYHEELTRVAAEVPWLSYVATISRPWEDVKWTGETGRVDDLIRKYADQMGLTGNNTTAYLCGHPTMIENGKGILHRHGWEKGSMFEEVYFIPAKDTQK